MTSKGLISLILLTGIQLFSINTRGQTVLDRNITVPDTTCQLYEALLVIESRTGYHFSYNSDLIDDQRRCQITASTSPVNDILQGLLNDPAIEYQLISNQIVLYKPDIKSDTLTSGDRENSGSYIFVSGTLLNKSTGDAIPYAAVALMGRNAGTISNSEGEFMLKISTVYLADTIGISVLGYLPYSVPAYLLSQEKGPVYLNPEYIPIQEVIIRRTEPVSLITSAMDKISVNYPDFPTMQTAFYRESIRKNNHYVAVSEAVLSIYKPPYDAELEHEQVKIIRGRKNIALDLTDTISMKLKGGINTSLILDIIKTHPDFLQKDYLHYYKYRMSDIVMYGDDYTYVIDFEQKKYTEPPHYQGRIYIDMTTLAILGIEFEMMPDMIDQASSYLVVRKPRDLTVKPLSAAYQVKYEKNNDKYYLNLIRVENKFRIRRKGQLFGNNFIITSELAVNQTDTLNIQKFRRREMARTDQIFTDLLGGSDPSFWGRYNYIIPDEPLEEALIRINRLMEEQE